MHTGGKKPLSKIVGYVILAAEGFYVKEFKRKNADV